MSARRVVAVCGAALAVATVGACADPESGQTGSSSTLTTTTAPTPTPAPSTSSSAIADISPEARQDMCNRLQGSVSDWRVQGPTLGTPALNLLVQEWAFNNGGLAMNARIVNDRTIPDEITVATCPDLRQQTMDALDLPDIATGLLGLG